MGNGCEQEIHKERNPKGPMGTGSTIIVEDHVMDLISPEVPSIYFIQFSWSSCFWVLQSHV